LYKFDRRRRLPKYFLHLWDGDALEEDDEGVDLPDLASAREEAQRFAAEIRCDLQSPEHARIEIADEDGRIVATIAIPPAGRPN
jgi:hypothetical protein